MDSFTKWKWQQELTKRKSSLPPKESPNWFDRISKQSISSNPSSQPSLPLPSSSLFSYSQQFVNLFSFSDTASLLRWCQTFLRHYHKWVHVLQFLSFTLYRIFPWYHSSGIGQLLYQIQQFLYFGYELVYFLLYITLDTTTSTSKNNNNTNSSNQILNQIRQQEMEDQLMLQNQMSPFYNSQMPYQQNYYNNTYSSPQQSYQQPYSSSQQNFWNTSSSQEPF